MKHVTLFAVMFISCTLVAAANAPRDANLIRGNAIRASTTHAGFAAEQAIDDAIRGPTGDNGLIFADNDLDQRLAVRCSGGPVREIRLLTNIADTSRVFELVTIRGSTREINSLDPADYELHLATETPEYIDTVGNPADAQVFGSRIAVDAPVGTKSLLFQFGAAKGSGDRVSEVQAFAIASPALPDEPRSQVQLSPDGRSIASMGWDTETGRRAKVNLLRKDQPAVLQFQRGGQWQVGGRIEHHDAGDGGFDLALRATADEAAGAEALRLIFPFDPRVSATTVVPARIEGSGVFRLPAVVSSPGFGQMLVSVSRPADAQIGSTLQGSRSGKVVDWALNLPLDSVVGDGGLTLSFRPLRLPPPKGLQDVKRWERVRRGWFNVFQVSAAWGDAGNPFSAPSGVLANNVISDPVSCCLFIYADSALWTPQAAPGVSLMARVGATLDWWLDHRMLPTGEVPGYWALKDFLDANPSLLIAAWDYFEATGERDWLIARLPKLEKAADFLAARDTDGDGLVEAVQSGNAGTLVQPARSCSAYDAVNCGHIDGYCNALTYRAFRCLAELEGVAGRPEQQLRYTQLADRLKGSFAKTLYNPETKLIAWWKSKDGALHDYAVPFVNGMAIEYGLVEPEQGRQILRALRERMNAAGFKRFDLGIPCTLIPVRREDYLLPDAPGLPKREDGSDTFGQYLNGGVITGDAVRYLAAIYTVGDADDIKEADRILDAMLARLGRGGISAGGFPINIVDAYPQGGEFWTWDGQTCGYEGLLSHAYHFVQAVVIREPAMRERMHRPLKSL